MHSLALTFRWFSRQKYNNWRKNKMKVVQSILEKKLTGLIFLPAHSNHFCIFIGSEMPYTQNRESKK
ncbi:MAG: hypothetical protein EA409_05855 [Saprospirales bacterium]|nr:MAG: hypothetical protein EA409_05855 [Saprospirales bacterium]